MKIIKIMSLVIMAYIASGCTTMADSIQGKGTGTSKIYDKPKSEVWSATVGAVSAVGLDLVSENESSNMILAQRGISAFSYGENVAIFVESQDENTCSVEVVSKKAMQTNIFAPDWSVSLFKYLDSKLK